MRATRIGYLEPPPRARDQYVCWRCGRHAQGRPGQDECFDCAIAEVPMGRETSARLVKSEEVDYQRIEEAIERIGRARVRAGLVA